MANENAEAKLVHDLMNDINGEVINDEENHEIEGTIKDILCKYNLSTDLTFVEKIGKLKFDKGESIDVDIIPKELKDAAYLPVNTIADIALRQDIELMVSQIPEWYTTLQVTRDAICEADVVKGILARTITFENTSLTDTEKENTMDKIEDAEERLELHSLIKNHIVYNTIFQGEGYLYKIPYAKVFEDLYKYRLNSHSDEKDVVPNMFETSSSLQGYGYGEYAIEKTLAEVSVINEGATQKHSKKHSNDLHNNLFTEQEIIEMKPDWSDTYTSTDDNNDEKSINEFNTKQAKMHSDYDAYLEEVSKNIRYISDDIALPIIEESAVDLQKAYDIKYGNKYPDGKECVDTFFESVVNETVSPSTSFMKDFGRVKGIYLKILPATKLIPIRIDRTIIGYYYISDLTRPESQGERKNSGLSGYTLRTPSIGYDTFAPDRMFCDKLANKIIQNFNLKFMRDNTALHEQIVAILQSHKFNESLMRFIFIPAENVSQFSINKDGDGKGHSILEPGLVTARMYMFLKLYSILYQVNNAEVRVYNLRMSGMDTNYKQFVQETMRKFAARRITANDIFNYRSSMTKVSGGSELIMPMGTNNEAPIQVSNIPAADAPLNNDLLNNMKHEILDSSPVPSAMVLGGASEMDFAKEVEISNTRFDSMISSMKIELNRDITKLYREILRWETDIDPEILKSLKYQFRQPSAKHLNITNDMISNFNSILEVLLPAFLTKNELDENNADGSVVVQEYRKLIIQELLPQIDVNHFDELARDARLKANRKILDNNTANKKAKSHKDEQNNDEYGDEGMV